jgi:hypothetical protein
MGAVRRVVPLFVAMALVTAGCGSSDSGVTPTACLASPPAYLKALEGAPGPARLAGGTPISDCLVENQSAGDLADVGASLVRAGTLLSAAARKDPAGEQTLRLGYLVGAVQAGTSETSGIHTDLARRIQATARFAKPSGRGARAFGLTYARGYAAGRSGG